MSHPTDANCIFCKIMAGQIPCLKLLEDEHTIAFMDINPVKSGPRARRRQGPLADRRRHPPDVLAAVAKTAQRIAQGGDERARAGGG